MALERIQAIELSVASTYLLIKDTTPIGDYTSNGIADPVNDVELIIYTLYDKDGNVLHTEDLTFDSASLRSVDGLQLKIDGLSDGIHISELIYTFSSVEYPSETKDCFYSKIKNDTSIKCLPSNWKDSSNPLSLMSYSKYTVMIKKLLDSISTAATNNLYEEFNLYYNKLNGVL